MKDTEEYKQIIKSIDKLIKQQSKRGNYDYDPYMHGLLNGMIFIRSVITDEKPEFVDAPKKWLKYE